MKKSIKKLVKCGMLTSAVLLQSAAIAKGDENSIRGLPAGGAITDGTATYTVVNYTNLGGMASNIEISDGPAGDALFESGLFYRIDGDAQETDMATPTSESFVGNTGLMVWDNVDNRNLFSSEYMVEIAQGAAGVATLTQTWVVRNISADTVTLDLFRYEDYDGGGSFAGDTAVLTNDPDFITVTNGTDTIEYRAGGNDAYQVTVYETIRQFLADAAVNDLDNTGLPFPSGDFTGAYQWSAVIPQFGSFTIQTTSGFNTAADMPMDAVLIDDVIFRNGFDPSAVVPVR